MKTIAVSAGWGYGNLGDDALLESTISLINKVGVFEEIIWYTFDIEQTKKSELVKTGIIRESLHRRLYGNYPLIELNRQGFVFSFLNLPWFTKRALEITQGFILALLYKVKMRFINRNIIKDQFIKELSGCEVYLMSGGGYFNSWDTMFESKIIELECAKKAGCRIVIFGQSIGPFDEFQKKRLQTVSSNIDAIFVRDPISQFELREFNNDVRLIPDIALQNTSMSRTEKKYDLCIVPAELSKDQIIMFASVLQKIPKMRICLTVSRLFVPDIHVVRKLAAIMNVDNHHHVELVIPKSYNELRTILESSEKTLSRGMHAIIISWLAGVQVFSLTKSRKIDALMNDIGRGEFVCAESMWEEKLGEKMSVWFTGGNKNNTNSDYAEKRKNFEDIINSNFKYAISVQ